MIAPRALALVLLVEPPCVTSFAPIPFRRVALAPAAKTLSHTPYKAPGTALSLRLLEPHLSGSPAAAAAASTRRGDARMLLGWLFGNDPADPVERMCSKMRSVAWFSWWAQAILSTVSGVSLLFANSVANVPTTIALVGRIFAIGGLGSSIASTLWAVSYARLAARLRSANRSTPMSAEEAAERAKGLVKVGIALNVAGMVLCIVGAEAIVGSLAAKALTQSATATTGSIGVITTGPAVQALDILIVQANTNLIFSHFISLVGGLRLRGAAETCAASER
jgi:hypothetical protein